MTCADSAVSLRRRLSLNAAIADVGKVCVDFEGSFAAMR